MKPIAIYGAGGLGKEVACLIKAINIEKKTWELVGYYDDAFKKGELVGGIPMLGNIEDLKTFEGYLVIAIGDPAVKKRIVSSVYEYNVKYATLIHPKATLMDESKIEIGMGSIITAGVVLTTHIKIGNHVLVNLNSTVGHDVKIGSFTSIMCGVNIAGMIKISKEVFIGSGSNVINGKVISSNVTIGAGSVVIDNVPSGKTVVGVPAKAI